MPFFVVICLKFERTRYIWVASSPEVILMVSCSFFVAGGRRSAWRPGWIRVRAGEERADWPARQTRGFGKRV